MDAQKMWDNQMNNAKSLRTIFCHFIVSDYMSHWVRFPLFNPLQILVPFEGLNKEKEQSEKQI